jgi:hypothetical protein
MVQAYWLIGREIVEIEQQGKKRAGYGDRIIQGLAAKLTAEFGSGYSIRSLRRIRQFYLTYRSGSAVPTALSGPEKRPTALAESPRVAEWVFPASLSWAHYLFLLNVDNPDARAFYEIEALREAWSARELERQIASLLFERLAKSRDKEKLLALVKKGQEVTVPRDVIKDPFVLEFLDLPERHTGWNVIWSKRSSTALRTSCWNLGRAFASLRDRSALVSTATIFTWISSFTTAFCAVSS